MTSSRRAERRARRPVLPRAGLTGLAAAIFVSACGEFLPGGLIPDMSSDLGLAPGVVGQLVTVFALTVVVTTIPLSHLTRRLPRKRLLLAAFAAVVLGNLLVAVAPTFAVLISARVLGALGHGLFWSVVFAYIAQLVEPQHLGRAVSFASVGASIASIAGIPLGNALGHLLGWRLAFGAVALVGAAIVVVIALLLPAVDHEPPALTGAVPIPVRRDPSLRGVLVLCGVIVVLAVGITSFGTYSAVWLTAEAGLPRSLIPVALLVQGAVGAISTFVKGPFIDRRPQVLLIGSLALLEMAYVALVLTGPTGDALLVIGALVLSAFAWGGVTNILQMRVMQVASLPARTVASAVQATAFNVGIAGGALTGGLVLDAGGAAALPWTGGAIMAVGLVCAVLLERMIAATRRRPDQSKSSTRHSSSHSMRGTPESKRRGSQT